MGYVAEKIAEVYKDCGCIVRDATYAPKTAPDCKDYRSKIETSAMNTALRKLDVYDRSSIEWYSEKLQKGMHNFGDTAAKELLFHLGIYLSQFKTP